MSLKIGVVLLSRFNSSRLPGKALMKINEKPVLHYIIERINKVFSNENIVIATSINKCDDPIVKFANAIGVNVYRGDLNRVADRFYNAGKLFQFDYIIRINGDNIFLDSNLLKEMVDCAHNGKYLFLSNVKDRTYPKGMSIEIVNVNYYGEVLSLMKGNANFEEHVTSYFYENVEQEKFKFFYNTMFPNASGIQLALDTMEDFERSRKVINSFKTPQQENNLKEIIEILKNEKF